MIDAAKALARLALSQAKEEAGKTARTIAVEAVLWLFALFLLCLTVGFAVLAAYLALAEAFGPVIAALVMAGICLVSCLIIAFVVALRRSSHRKPSPPTPKTPPHTTAPPELVPAVLIAGFLTGLFSKPR